jgi:hypothetical protein
MAALRTRCRAIGRLRSGFGLLAVFRAYTMDISCGKDLRPISGEIFANFRPDFQRLRRLGQASWRPHLPPGPELVRPICLDRQVLKS